MFKKLLSNLPFNPSLIGQVSFYARRMHSEASLRRLGVAVLALAMLVQMFAVISPPEPTLANSGNDIVDGGFQTREQAVLHCLNSSLDFRPILEYYGVSCEVLANAETVTLRSTDYERKLDSLGRWPQGATIPRTGKPTEQYDVSIPGAHTALYMRNLWAWDSGAYSTYKFLRMQNKYGHIIMVMYDCGNIVTIDRFSPPPPPAPAPPTPGKTRLELRKENSPSAMVAIGEEITYSLYYRNTGTADATRMRVKDTVPANTELVSVDPGSAKHSVNKTTWEIMYWHPSAQEALGVSQDWHVVRYKVKVKSMPSGNNSICNIARIESDQESIDSNEVCNYVQAPATPTQLIIPTVTLAPPAANPGPPQSALLVKNKRARNVTQNIADANNTTAKAGDEIQYIISVKNTGNAIAKNFVIEESLGDVMEYADLKSLDGGNVSDKKVASWPAVNINPGDTTSRTILVKVKTPIPNTPISVSHLGSFDLIMTNVYGDTINIKLPAAPIKVAEMTTQKLPNTGPGESMAAVVAITIIAGYFFARSRLMAKELDMVRTDFASSGGY